MDFFHKPKLMDAVCEIIIVVVLILFIFNNIIW